MTSLTDLQRERKRLRVALDIERGSHYPDKDARIATYRAQLDAVNAKIKALTSENGGAA